MTRVQLNGWFIKDEGVFFVGSLQVTEKMITNCNLINPTLDYVCGCLPCFSQWLGFFLRHRWRSKEVLFLERKGETPSIAASTSFLSRLALQAVSLIVYDSGAYHVLCIHVATPLMILEDKDILKEGECHVPTVEEEVAHIMSCVGS